MEHIAVGAFIGALSACAVKGLVDLLFRRFGPCPDSDPHAALADAAYREIDRVRLRQRRRAYQDFDDKLLAAVEEMSQGWNRMSLIYAARDRFFALKRLAPDAVVRPARKMCDICAEMMERGYSDLLHNRFHRAQIDFHDACRRNLSTPGTRRAREDDARRLSKPERKYITPQL